MCVVHPMDRGLLPGKKKTRTRQRTQLTTLYKVIIETVQQRGSRTAVTTLLDQAMLVLKASNDLNEELTRNPANANEEYQKQSQKQLNYVKGLAETKEMVDEYLRERRGEAPSVSGSQIHPPANQRIFTSSRAPSSHVSTHHSSTESFIPNYQLSVLEEDVESHYSEARVREPASDDWVNDYKAVRNAGDPITR